MVLTVQRLKTQVGAKRRSTVQLLPVLDEAAFTVNTILGVFNGI
jgi:hypothetical protein